MDGVRIARALAGVLLVMAAAATPFLIGALATGATSLALGFGAPLTVAAFFGGAVMLGARGRRGLTARREGVLFLFLAWALAPAFAAPPLLTEAGWARAYFDAVSALSTTGFPPAFSAPFAADGDDGLAPAASQARIAAQTLRIVWWNALQWLGGAAALVGIFAILSGLHVAGGPQGHLIARTRATVAANEDVLARLTPVSRAVAGPYAAASAGVFLIALAAGAPMTDALCVAFSAVSTGGLLLTDGGLSLAGAPLGVLAAGALGLVFGALSFPAVWESLRTGGPRAVLQDRETLALMGLVAVWCLAAATIDWPRSGEEAVRAGFEVVALATTGGWESGALGINAFGAPLVFAAVLFGGAVVSTAGGLKLARVILLVAEIGDELRALAHPSSVSPHPGGDRRAAAIAGLGAYAVGFAAAIGGLMIALGAAGAALDVAAAGAVAAVANAGPVLHITVGLRDAAALLESPAGLAMLCGGMVLGRVEVLAVVTVFLRAFWRG